MFRKICHHTFNRIPEFIALFLFIYVAIKGHQVTSGLNLPYGWDQYREVAMAQCMLDGRYPEDPIFLHEKVWYNPLVAFIVAQLSRITGMVPMTVDVHYGPYLNLLVPIMFFILACFVFDRWAGLLSLIFFLFFTPKESLTEGSASYSPWLFAAQFSQALFYLTMVLYLKACRSEKRVYFIFSGILLGLTFMGHAFPALLAGGIISIVTLIMVFKRLRSEGKIKAAQSTILNYVYLIVSAFIVSLPFSYSLIFMYKFKIVNHVPSEWLWDFLKKDNLKEAVKSFISGLSLISVFGLAALCFARRKTHEKIIVASWIAISAFFLSVTYINQYIDDPAKRFLNLVPSYHYYMYLCAARNLMFGPGVMLIIASGVKAFKYCQGKLQGRHFAGRSYRRIQHAIAFLAALLMIFLMHQQMMTRPDYKMYSTKEAFNKDNAPFFEAYCWLLSHTRPDDVFLQCEKNRVDIKIVSPAGRKLVTMLSAFFSNPYIDFSRCYDTWKGLHDTLVNGDVKKFLILAKEKHLAYIITMGDPEEAITRKHEKSYFHLCYDNKGIKIYRIANDFA